jgi:thiol-disulfide isomerase/thioredoxin
MSNTQKRYDSYANFNAYADSKNNNSGPYKKYKQVGQKDEPRQPQETEQVQTTAKQAIRNPAHFTIDSNQNTREFSQDLSLQRSQAPQQPHPSPIYTPLSKVSQPPRDPSTGVSVQNFGKEASLLASQKTAPMETNLQGPPVVKEIQGKELYNLLTHPNFKFSRSGKPSKLIVKLFTDWCGPCKTLEPQVEALARDPKYKDFLFLAVNPEKMGVELGSLPPFDKVGAVPITYSFHGQKHQNTAYGAKLSDVKEICDHLESL